MNEDTIDYKKLAEALAEALEQRNLWIEGEEYRELVILRKRLSARVDSLAEELKAANARIAKLEDEIAKMKKYFHKPEHGSCCTCQKCGHIYDECRCDFDETYDENDILTARNAELEAFVNRLIEAGNTIVFETFEGYKKHGLFDFAPVNTWQVLVKDWLVKEREE